MAIAQVNHSFILDRNPNCNLIHFVSIIFQDCFVATCNPDKMTTADNIGEICQPNANVEQIKAKIQNLKVCIDESDQKKGDICKDCCENHTQLENHLEQLMSGRAGVCFEIIDVVISFLFFNESAHYSNEFLLYIAGK